MACSSTGPDGSASVDVAADTSAVADDAGGDVTLLTDAAGDTAGADTAAADTAGGEDVDVDASGGETEVVDASPVDVGLGDIGADAVTPSCCKADGDCAPGQVCAPLGSASSSFDGQCIDKFPGAGLCWSDVQCANGESCVGAALPKCGGGTPTPGVCQVLATNCCDLDGLCGGGKSCQDGWCVDVDWSKDACLADYECSKIGWVCAGGSTATGACDESAASPPIFGTCEPSGPGGLCLTFSSGFMGNCSDPIGWGWTGTGCTELAGCDCGELCGDLFGTESECLTACSPPTCCASDDECGSGRVCHLGNCTLAPTEGQCFKDGDCVEGLICANASYCACGDKYCGPVFPLSGGPICIDPPCPESTSSTKAGTCILPPVCCGASTDCHEDEVCVPVPWSTSRCEPLPGPGACWSAADCGDGEFCDAPSPCGCGDINCVSAAGVCLPKLPGCCVSDAECSEGQVCTALPPGSVAGQLPGAEVGRCVDAPPSGQCYTELQCGPDEQCQYFQGDTCSDSTAAPYPGSCAAKDGLCCGADSECADGFQCVQPAPASGRVCKPIPDPGACWSTADCGDGEVCDGAKACGGCSSVCSSGGQPGACVAAAGLCCSSDADCGSGDLCTAVPAPKPWMMAGSEFGQCISAVSGQNACVSATQCGFDEVCTGFSGLPCGVSSGGGSAWYPGYCVTSDGACCTSDLDCAPNFHCAGGKTSPAGNIEGMCKPLQTDGVACWGDVDCGGGQVCEGAFVCGCSYCGGQPDTLGTCVDAP